MMRALAPATSAAGLYLALTLAITWPLATSIGRKLAGDLGDPLFVAWVMTWVMSHVTRILTGDVTALGEFWHANIFYPERNTLAFSEHFVAQSIPLLPVWWLTGNPLLAYNLAVIAAFVLTGLGTFLLTRSLTGGFVAPLLAGAFAAFNPYRLGLELSHLHVLSIQWLPLALLGLHRFIASGALAWLAATTAFVIALNLSSAYYMLFCAPFLVGFAVIDLAVHGRPREQSRWGGLAVSAMCIAVVTLPFVLPYLAVHRQLGFERSFEEIRAHSATLQQYATYVLPWAPIPVALAGGGILGLAFRRPAAPRALTLTLLGCLVLAFLLSLGPILPLADTRGPYWLLYEHVPGFKGLRVVNRYAALVLVFLPVLAGIGAAAIARVSRVGAALVLAVMGGFLWQVWPGGIPLSAPLPSLGLQPAPAYLEPTPLLPGIYRAVQHLEGDAVLAEFPFGDFWYDIRYTFFSGAHQRRLMNGYSGVFPPSYIARQRVLTRPLDHSHAVRSVLGGATHVVVHSAVWPDDTGVKLVGWFESIGATRVAEADGAVLLALK